MAQESNNKTRVITGKVRLSYIHLFEAHAVNEGDDPKYSASIIIPKSDTKTINAIKNAIKAAYEEGKNKLSKNGKTPTLKAIKKPLRDGDTDESKEDDDAYNDAYFINASSNQKPGVIGPDKSVLDSTQIKSGDYARVSINLFAYNTGTAKGIAAGLNNVQKWCNGEALGGRAAAEDEFDELDLDESEVFGEESTDDENDDWD